MKYLCLAYEEESKLNALSKSEWDALRAETVTYVEELRSSGCLISTEPLQSVSTAATVRVRGGKLSITDGPFAETKEQLGGYHVVECRDLDAALAMAAQIPTLDAGGTIEVRALQSVLGAPPR
jgi:hypothetical protein